MDRPSNAAAGLAQAAEGRRIFSIHEAQRALVLVRRIVADIVAEYPYLLDLQDMLEGFARHGSTAEAQRAQEEVGAVVARLQGYARELDDMGIEVRDFSRGVVDFPVLMDGREVRLCWRFGEQEIRHWHEIGEGFDDRKLLGQYRPVARPAVRRA